MNAVEIRDKIGKYEIALFRDNILQKSKTLFSIRMALDLAEAWLKTTQKETNRKTKNAVPVKRPKGLTGKAECLSSLGMEDRFDVGQEYKLVRGPVDGLMIVVDKNGQEVDVLEERFKITVLQPKETKAEQRAKKAAEERIKRIKTLTDTILASSDPYKIIQDDLDRRIYNKEEDNIDTDDGAYNFRNDRWGFTSKKSKLWLPITTGHREPE